MENTCHKIKAKKNQGEHVFRDRVSRENKITRFITRFIEFQFFRLLWRACY